MAILGGPKTRQPPTESGRLPAFRLTDVSIERVAMSSRPPRSSTHMDLAEQNNDRNRWLALYVLCTGMLMIVLDATIVNVALPTIQDGLGFSQSNLAWVVNAYLIPFGGLLLLAGRLGDLVGQRRVFLVGLTIFTSASLLCAASHEPGDADRRPLRPGHRRRAAPRR